MPFTKGHSEVPPLIPALSETPTGASRASMAVVHYRAARVAIHRVWYRAHLENLLVQDATSKRCKLSEEQAETPTHVALPCA